MLSISALNCRSLIIKTLSAPQEFRRYPFKFFQKIYEDAFDAISRSVETCIEMGEPENLQPQDVLRFGNVNRICHNIINGKISPWILYCSDSGVQFLETLNQDQVTMISDYINPELWALKFHRDPDVARKIRDTLREAGY